MNCEYCKKNFSRWYFVVFKKDKDNESNIVYHRRCLKKEDSYENFMGVLKSDKNFSLWSALEEKQKIAAKSNLTKFKNDSFNGGLKKGQGRKRISGMAACAYGL